MTDAILFAWACGFCIAFWRYSPTDLQLRDMSRIDQFVVVFHHALPPMVAFHLFVQAVNQ